MTNNKELTSTHFDNQKMENINNNKKSSIDWYAHQIEILHYDYFTEHISKDEKNQRLKQLKEQAKAMHKQEIVEAYYIDNEKNKGFEYYNAKFGGSNE